MKTYLAGPMRGIPSFNFPAFDHYAAKLRAKGYEVISPAESDRTAGFDPTTDDPDEIFMREAVARDMAAICHCDALALMPGWEQSEGANAELAVARLLKLDIIDADTGERIGENILDEAKRLTTGPRNLDYGHPSEDFGRTAKLWSVILGVQLTPKQCVMCMIAVKLSRLCNAYKRDSVVDIAGYANLLDVMAQSEEEAA